MQAVDIEVEVKVEIESMKYLEYDGFEDQNFAKRKVFLQQYLSIKTSIFTFDQALYEHFSLK